MLRPLADMFCKDHCVSENKCNSDFQFCRNIIVSIVCVVTKHTLVPRTLMGRNIQRTVKHLNCEKKKPENISTTGTRLKM